jgi:trigger factor
MEQVTQARDKVLEAIVEGTEVPLPESVVKAEVDSALHDAIHGFDHDEQRFEEFLQSQSRTREEFDTEVRDGAERSVRTRLVLDALADAREVTVSEQEFTERVIYQAQQMQIAPEEFVQRLQQAGQLGAVFSDVRRSKALIAAVRAATVTDASGAEVDLSDVLGDEEAASEAGAAEASTEEEPAAEAKAPTGA